MSEKTNLEKAAINRFCEKYNTMHGAERISFIELSEPPLPDCKCMHDGNEQYVEIAHTYGTESDAKLMLGREGKYAASEKEARISRMIPLHIRIVEPLNDVLRKKASKSYSATEPWLVIRSGNPLWVKTEFQENIDLINVPKEHPFSQIWLICGPYEFSDIVRLA